MKKLPFLFLFISLFGYAQTPITDTNFYSAINTCLTTNPVDGLCSDSEYGAMPDWDVSNVTDMSRAFKDKATFNGGLSSWNVISVTNMSDMFLNASSFNQDISSWDVSNVTNMFRMFYNTPFNQDIGSWDVSNVTDMRVMFYNASSFNQDIGSWDVRNVTTMNQMYSGASAFNQDISGWDVSNVTDMSSMFGTADAFNQDISSWDVSSVTDMGYMFNGASAFSKDISTWCVTNIVSEPSKFSDNSPLAESNKPVWGTCPTALTPITDDNFQQAVNTCLHTNPEYGMCTDSEYGAMPDWDVSQVTDMGYAFYSVSSPRYDFNADIRNWDVSGVSVFIGMFSGATSFNQDIGSWDVSNAIGMDEMFENAGDFNQDIGSWDVSVVGSMNFMFYGAFDFNQDLSSWCVGINEPILFSDYSDLTESNMPVWGTCPTASVDDQNQLDISIYPNPTNDKLFIQGLLNTSKVSIYNVLGKLVLSQTISKEIDVKQLSKGVYILKIIDEQKETVRKFIKD